MKACHVKEEREVNEKKAPMQCCLKQRLPTGWVLLWVEWSSPSTPAVFNHFLGAIHWKAWPWDINTGGNP